MVGFLLVYVFVCSLFLTGSFAIISVASVAQTSTPGAQRSLPWEPSCPNACIASRQPCIVVMVK